MSSERKWFYACMVLVFIAGFLSGAFFIPLMFRHHVLSPELLMPRRDRMERREFGKGPMEKPKDFFIGHLSRELSLSATQKNQLEKIIDNNEGKFMENRKQIRESFDKMRKSMDAQIFVILDDRQKKKFKEMQKKFEGMNGPPPPGFPDHEGHKGFEGMNGPPHDHPGHERW